MKGQTRMNEERIRALLGDVASGDVSPDDAYARLKDIPFEDIGIAKIDHHREMRTSQPEVVYGKDKTAEEIVAISRAILARENNLLVTKISKEKAESVLPLHNALCYNERGNILVGALSPQPGRGKVAVVSAGTSDRHIVEEAYETLTLLGNNAETFVDVGVAGIHRLFSRIEEIKRANVVIVVAGMEGALASVVGGLTGGVNVIAVPTSVGYGASFQGLSALLAMLNSCSPNVSVVNIDNGFGAAFYASLINRRLTGV